MRTGLGPLSAVTASSMCPTIGAWVPPGRAVMSPPQPLHQGWICPYRGGSPEEDAGTTWPWTCSTSPQEEAVFCFSTQFLV